MNETTPTPPAQGLQLPPPAPDPDYQAMGQHGFSQILNYLLKKPLSVIHEINHGERSPLPALLVITLVSLAIFGLVLGMFSAGAQLWAAPVKVIGGVLFSGLICLPSLYIFGALGGMETTVRQIIGLMLTFLAITSLLLVGFAPVVWLFSTSSNSLVFFGFLSLTIWLISLVVGLRIIGRASSSMGGGKGGYLHLWAVIFTVVTLQMPTTLRPIIGPSEDFLNLEEKRFFLVHWFETMQSGAIEEDSEERKTDGSPANSARTSSKAGAAPETNPYLEQ
ncbi:hypothetical protein JIN77_14100 [Verrucomicrobiaceae bacterium R5-34]|nr:hypothetical protein [Verrucomicrobiaceae bacterium R5-34]